MLSVTFTGNPTTDIPSSGAAGTVILSDPGPGAQFPVLHPSIPGYLKPYIPVSGFDINGIRLQYDAQLDTLNVGIQQPDSQTGNGKPVIAGDADDNGNGGTVNPDVLAVQPQFQDFPSLGGSEYMEVFLDLNNDGTPDVVAGVSNDPTVGKQYQVAQAIVNNGSTDQVANEIPPVSFGQTLPSNTGASFLNDTNPNTPGFEFQVTNFSRLYQEETGAPLSKTSTIQVGGSAGSADDFIGEAFFPGQTATFGVTPPAEPVSPPTPPCPPTAPPEPVAPPVVTPPPVVVPPLEPPIVINPHLHRHVNTAHPTDVRVTVLGSERFNVDQIIQSTVRLGGATPLYSFDLQATNQPFTDRTFVFRGSDINLPRGITLAEVTGTLTTGQTFDSYYQIFNRNSSYYTQGQVAEQQARQAAEGFGATNPPLTPSQRKILAKAHDLAIALEDGHKGQTFASSTPTVKIATRKNGTPKIPIAPSAYGSPSASEAVGSNSPAESATTATVNIPLRNGKQTADKGLKGTIGGVSGSASNKSFKAKPVTPSLNRSGMARAARSMAVAGSAS